MDQGRRGGPEPVVSRRIATQQFGGQMRLFERHLPACHRDPRRNTRAAELAAVKAVSATIGFTANRVQIRVQAGDRPAAGSKPVELWMTPIAARPPSEHGPREQAFAPDGDEAGRVEQAGM